MTLEAITAELRNAASISPSKVDMQRMSALNRELKLNYPNSGEARELLHRIVLGGDPKPDKPATRTERARARIAKVLRAFGDKLDT
jgi:hypothetical protein